MEKEFKKTEKKNVTRLVFFFSPKLATATIGLLKYKVFFRKKKNKLLLYPDREVLITN